MNPTALELARAAAARLAAGAWSLEAEPDALPDEAEPEPEPPPPAPPPPPRGPEAGLPGVWIPAESAAPPAPERIVEALLLAGGPPLTPADAAKAVRGLTPEAFALAVQDVARRYRRQRRPYAVRPLGGGYVLELRPEFLPVRDRLAGGAKEVKLSPAALDVLSLVAYRQPLGKADLDALRGADCGGPLRQLVRLGLVAAGRSGGAAGYRTTPRFLELFALSSLEDLPRFPDG